MSFTADAIQDHTRDPHTRIEVVKALYQRCRTARHCIRIDDQNHGRIEQTRQMRMIESRTVSEALASVSANAKGYIMPRGAALLPRS